RDRQQCVPHLALKGRTRHIQRQRELCPPAGKVLLHLALGFDEHGVVVDLRGDVQPHTTWPIVFPQDRGQTVVGRHERKSANGRRHVFVSHCTLLVPRCIGSVDLSDGLKITPVPRHCSPFSDTCPPE